MRIAEVVETGRGVRISLGHDRRADTGELVWKFDASDGSSSAPSVANGRVYFGSGDGLVFCLNAETGEKIWSYETEKG